MFRASLCHSSGEHGLVLLMMGIMTPETCLVRSLIINIGLVASCWLISLHHTFHDARSQEPKTRKKLSLSRFTSASPDIFRYCAGHIWDQGATLVWSIASPKIKITFISRTILFLRASGFLEDLPFLRRVRNIAKKRLLASSCLSVCLSVRPPARLLVRPSVSSHGTTRHPQEGFSWNLVF